MSHIRCPLCGKNAPISSFDPSSLDLDLKLVSFRGLGRGKGFEVSEEHSVLGDEEYSPLIAERVLDLCKMFVDAGVIDLEHALRRLGLQKTMTPPVAFPKPPQPRFTPSLRRDSNRIEISQLRDTIEKMESELAQERIIDRELLKFINHYPYVKINWNDEPWTIELTNIDVNCLLTFINLYSSLNRDVQNQLQKRMKTNNPLIKRLMAIYMSRPERSMTDILRQYSYGNLYNPNFYAPNNISNRWITINPTVQKTPDPDVQMREHKTYLESLELEKSRPHNRRTN